MKPNFALNFTDDSIILLHRVAKGWMEVGSSRIEAPDLDEALNYLRGSALGLAPHGVTAKLVIPNSQILYTEVDAPGPDDEQRQKQIRQALEGMTPYAVDDLAFDWSGDGTRVKVAVVARETLAEAEAFAAQHRFNPVSFVALPENPDFPGEPWFGPTTLAANLIPEGETLERDADAILVITRESRSAEPQKAAASATDKPAGTSSGPATAEPEPEPETPEPAPAPVSSAAGPASDDTSAGDDTPAELPDGPDLSADAKEPAAGMQPDESDAVETAPVVSATAQVVTEPETALPEAEPPEADPPEWLPEPQKPSDPAAPGREPQTQGRFHFASAGNDTPETAAEDPPSQPKVTQTRIVDTDEPAASFATRRGDETKSDNTLEPSATAPKVSVTGVTAHRRTATSKDSPAEDSTAGKTPDTTADTGLRAPDKAPAHSPASETAAIPDDDIPPAPAGNILAARMAAQRPKTAAAPKVAAPSPKAAVTPTKPLAEKPAKGLSGMVTAPGIAGLGNRKSKKQKNPGPQAAADTLVAPPPSEDMPFQIGRAPRRGKPRFLGVFLTLALLLVLAAVAAWSSFTQTRNENDGATSVAALSPDAGTASGTPAPAADSDIPAAEDEAAADGVDLSEGIGAAENTPVETEPQQAAALPEADLDAGAAPVTLPGTQDEIILATMDTPPDTVDPLVLSQPQTGTDISPGTPAPPPPFGTQYTFNDAGMIAPVAGGIMTPDGVHLVAGPPPIIPLPRPASIAALAPSEAPAETPETPAAATDTGPEATAPYVPYADPALSGFRPRPRPEGLEVPAAISDDAALETQTTLRVSSMRPRARPASVVAAAQAAAQSTLDEEALRVAQAASLSMASDAQAAALARGPVSPQAVSISRRPAARPKNLSRAVEAAVAAASRPQKSQTQGSSNRAVPGEDEEPEIAAAARAPKIPATASVAKNATYVNAINLRQTNLIGVYGKPSRRYALIRTGSGRYKKVRVGDRIDGGTVAAITDSELRYKKGGRMVALKMPKG